MGRSSLASNDPPNEMTVTSEEIHRLKSKNTAPCLDEEATYLGKEKKFKGRNVGVVCFIIIAPRTSPHGDPAMRGRSSSVVAYVTLFAVSANSYQLDFYLCGYGVYDTEPNSCGIVLNFNFLKWGNHIPKLKTRIL
ncbi:hypothetical protein ACJJTC_000631 [Scirpophaga incertulas]